VIALQIIKLLYISTNALQVISMPVINALNYRELFSVSIVLPNVIFTFFFVLMYHCPLSVIETKQETCCISNLR